MSHRQGGAHTKLQSSSSHHEVNETEELHVQNRTHHVKTWWMRE